MFAASLIIAYLLGSLSTAIILAKLLKLDDPRDTGSGNPGATNMLRSAGKKIAALVLAGDMLKGLLSVWIAIVLGNHGFALACVALAAVVGHIFPLFFHFKGGKGVATAFGVILGLSGGAALIGAMTWGLCLFFTKYSSLSALIATGAIVLFSFAATPQYALPVLAIAVLIVWRHKGNIERLKQGKESKVNF
ncbi:MAG: glycerol-3-phosphate acyltransferase [marine bacterium B5-7]|nr:MAG: glycerol-3-phosphate acyltransferase [marine bacterium B5-7]